MTEKNQELQNISASSPDASREEALHAQIKTADETSDKDPEAALALINVILEMAEIEDYPHACAQAYRVRASCHGAHGNLEASGKDFQASLERAEALNDLLLQAQSLHGLGMVHFNQGEMAVAVEYMHCSIALRRVIGNERGLIGGLNSLGAFLAEMGDFAEAVVYFTDALQFARKCGATRYEALTLSNIGQATLEFGEPEQAIEYLVESLPLIEEAGFRIQEPVVLEILAMAHYRCDRLEEALNFAQKALQVCHDIGNPHLEVNALYAIATIQRDRGDLDTAEELFHQALQMAQTVPSDKRMAEIYCGLGKLYVRKSNFDAARKYLEDGITYAQQTQQKQHLSELQLVLSDLYTATGDCPHAFEAFRAYHTTYLILQKESAQNRLSAQMAGLEAERARQQAEIHRLRNIELVEANRQNTELVEQLQLQARKLAELVIKDPLTGLYNRRYLQDYLQHALEEAHHRSHLSIAVADLDNFKQVNDRFSHLIGDEVLKATARLIQNTVRHSDIAVRFGGEEFVIVLPDLLRSGAIEVCERVRQAIAAYDWASIHPNLKMSTSIGVADTMDDLSAMAELGSPTEQLLGLADQRLYHAKEAGKNRVV